jgi:hypothetical protein
MMISRLRTSEGAVAKAERLGRPNDLHHLIRAMPA